MVRIALLLALLRWCSSPVQGQYTFHLESGDSITAPSYFLRLDSICLPDGKVGMEDVLYMSCKRGIYIFKLPSSPARQVRIYDFGSACALGKLYAERYSNMGRDRQREVMEYLESMQDTVSVGCYRKALYALGSNLYRPDRPGLDKGVEELSTKRSKVILRTGDTLLTEGTQFMAGDSLVYFRMNKRVHKDEVLFLITINGQRYIEHANNELRLLQPPVGDLSSCSKGLIYASIYFGSDTEWAVIPNLGSAKEEEEAVNCYKAEMRRLRTVHPNRSK